MSIVNLILDEAAGLGPHMGCLEDSVDKYRGYGIRVQFYFQALAQLKTMFPNDQGETVLANVSQVYFSTDAASAEMLSNRLGEQTIVVPSWGDSDGQSTQRSGGNSGSSASESWNRSRNWSHLGRKLLHRDEIAALDGRIAITLTPGQRPIWTVLERYYEKKGSPSIWDVFKTLVGSAVIFAAATYLLFVSIKIWEESHRGRFVQTTQSHRSGSVGRGQATRPSRLRGTGQRPIQRQRIRPVWPGTKSNDAHEGAIPTVRNPERSESGAAAGE